MGKYDGQALVVTLSLQWNALPEPLEIRMKPVGFNAPEVAITLPGASTGP